METVTETPVDEIPGQTEIGDDRRSEFEEEAGPAVGEMPPAPPQDETVPVEEIRVDGTAQLGIFDAGGKRPNSASLTLTGGKVLLVDGKAFKKGDVIKGEFVAVVGAVGQQDKADPKTGIVVSCEQKHGARITDLRVTETLSS